jgi:hypothetical protein
MDIAAVRTGTARDRVYVTRSDGGQLFWDWNSYGEGLPHDLVHYVVETALDLNEGFWGLVADGVNPTRVNKAAERIATGVTLRDMTDRSTDQLVLAEFAVAAVGALESQPVADALADFATRCEDFGVDVPDDLTAERLTEIADLVDRMTTRWSRLPDGVALEVSFPPEPPQSPPDRLPRR